jgi:hypothetical protein
MFGRLHKVVVHSRHQRQAVEQLTLLPLGDRQSCLVYDVPSASDTSIGIKESLWGARRQQWVNRAGKP